jgi:hypothetical protein
MTLVKDIRHTNGGVNREVQVLDRLSRLVNDIAEMNLDGFQVRKNDLTLLRRQKLEDAIRSKFARGSRHWLPFLGMPSSFVRQFLIRSALSSTEGNSTIPIQKASHLL